MIPTLMHPLGISPAYRRRLQYIASTGTQYIDTGVRPDYANGDQVEIRFMAAAVPSTTYYIVFGSRSAQARNGFIFEIEGRTPPPLRFICFDNSGYIGGDFAGFPFSSGNILSVTVNDSKISLIGPDYQDSQTNPRRITSEYSAYLFGFNNGGTFLNAYPGMRLYDWKYWRNGTLAQHLVPVLDKSGVPCMYDTVTRTLKYNAGSGTFNYA